MISIAKLSIRAGAFTLRDLDLEVGAGQYAILMGKTGCGKTTLLEVLCGLRHAAAGRIVLAGRDVTRLKPAERGIGYVPQDRCLFQTISVRENLAFALTVRRWKPRQIDSRVEELARLLGITHLLGRRPHGLSGGEAQRVALGRALAFEPAILCLDEPLSALDAATRQEMHDLLLAIKARTRVTILHVTHDWNEAVRLADQLFLMKDGAIHPTAESQMQQAMSADANGQG